MYLEFTQPKLDCPFWLCVVTQMKLMMPNIKTQLLAVVMGGVCLYLYICFAGVFSVFLVDIGYLQYQAKFICSLGFSPVTRKILYWSVISVQDLIVQIAIVILILYFFSEKFRLKLYSSIFFLLVGSVISDFFVFNFSQAGYSSSIFSNSHFFSNIYISFFCNSVLWCFVFFISILIGKKIYVSQHYAS